VKAWRKASKLLNDWVEHVAKEYSTQLVETETLSLIDAQKRLGLLTVDKENFSDGSPEKEIAYCKIGTMV
jgi:hypothetical protein